jgi:hypothetical protein
MSRKLAVNPYSGKNQANWHVPFVLAFPKAGVVPYKALPNH